MVDDPVFKRDPGALNHSRWLTTANRLLRYYVTQANPSRNLLLVAEYVMKVYAPMWFKIKCSPSAINGAKHLHETIKKRLCFSPAIQEIVLPILQKNGYFAHSENALLAMVNDENKIIRELGLRKVLHSRKLCNSVTILRTFKIPNINFDADNFYHMIDWQNVVVTPPPLLHDVADDVIWTAVNEGTQISSGNELLNIPCHTQAIERMIKLVTTASSKVCGQKSGDGYIKAVLQSRKMIASFETKSQFQA